MDASGAVFGNALPMQFLNADFEDGDAGSGEAGAGAFVSPRGGVVHLLQHHMNSVTRTIPDGRDFVRPWSVRLRDILLLENETYVGFLEKPLAEWPAVERHRNFLQALNTSSISSSAHWIDMHIATLVDKPACLAEIDEELETPLDILRSDVHKLLDMYLLTLSQLFELEESIVQKLEKLERLQKQLESFASIDGDEPCEELEKLHDSIIVFIQSKYKSWGIAAAFKEFVKQYTRFQAFRSILLAVQAGSNTDGQPICSICTVGDVSTALVPCGHVFCNNCAQKQRSQCYICRTTVQSKLRVYFN